MAIPERLPFEDSDAGLYLHEPDRGDLLEQRSGLDGTTRYYVPVEQFMAMQKQRDEYRKACALVNGWRRRPGRNEAALERLLASVGFTDEDGDAIEDIVRWATSLPSTEERS